jgi:manganese oxidase
MKTKIGIVVFSIFMLLLMPALANAQTAEQIQKEIVKLQQQLTSIKQQTVQDRSLLYTGNLPKPTLTPAVYEKTKNCNPDQSRPAINSTKFLNNWRTYLTDFHCGHVVKSFAENNTSIREFKLIVTDNHGFGNYVPITLNQSDPVNFPIWAFNNTVPGPTLRMTQGDIVKITVINDGKSKFPHSFHMHSIHAGAVDGMNGPGGSIQPGQNFTYTFVARPFGVYPYHCHMEPVQMHIMHGLYGMMIIDPPTPRPAAKELVLMMNGYSFNGINLNTPTNEIPVITEPPTAQQLRSATTFPEEPSKSNDDILSPGGAGSEEDNDNQFYTVNGMAFGYMHENMIHLKTKTLYRIYLANMVEFDPVNSFHLHGNMFVYYPSGTSMKPSFIQDILTLGQGDRGILEFSYPLAGDYMFHAHINRFTNLGWAGMFHVTDKDQPVLPPVKQVKPTIPQANKTIADAPTTDFNLLNLLG